LKGIHDDGDFGGGAFGVRRPLRFLAFKLELREEQFFLDAYAREQHAND
jgi:hypothetical protein